LPAVELTPLFAQLLETEPPHPENTSKTKNQKIRTSLLSPTATNKKA